MQSFIDMGGHGPYVWACYGLTFAALIYIALEPKIQFKRFVQQQRKVAQRKANQSEEVNDASA